MQGASRLFFVAATATLGGLLFGFDVAIITGAGPFLEQKFQLSPLALGVLFSSLLFGCVIGSAFAGTLADHFGRRRPLLGVALLFAITSLACGLAGNFAMLLVARFLGGIAVGVESALTPMYIAEVSPRGSRGKMGTLYQLSIVSGITVSYCINYLLHGIGDWNWRWMFITGAFPAVLFWIMLQRVPESPRFLVLKGRLDEARGIFTRWLGSAAAEREVAEIAATTAGKNEGWRELRRTEYRPALRLGFILAVLVHFSGINTVVDYAPRILQSAGWSIDTALFSTFGIGLTFVLFTLVSFWVIDRFGRRPLYIVGSTGMGVMLLGLVAAAALDRFSGPLVFGLLIAYIAFFAACVGPVFWTLVPEIFPNRIRGEAVTVPVLTQWVANAVVVLLFPAAFHHVGVIGTFAFLAATSLTQAWFAYRQLPETKGKSLEEIEKMWVSLAR
jgi:SP family arabinose:H+ symporter-like MFS transporter